VSSKPCVSKKWYLNNPIYQNLYTNIIQKEDDSILYIGGSKTVIYAFSLQSHEIIDIWTVGENITSMDCLSQQEGSTLLAFGSEKGNIFLRQDWEELPKNFEPKDSGKDSKIMDLKFSSDGEFLIAAAVENQDQYTIFIFK